MSEMSQTKPRRPSGIQRLLFRAPIWLYRWRLGWMLGRRFLLLNHVGRKSGLPRQAVVEVTRHDPQTDSYYIAAGFGKQSDWYQNLRQTPDVTIQVGRRRLAVRAELLSPEESGQEMARYARTYPVAARTLSQRLLGYEVDGSEESYRTLGQEVVPFVALRPRQPV